MSVIINAKDPNWLQDYANGENQYQNQCPSCDRFFFGHKRRVFCQSCVYNELEMAKDAGDVEGIHTLEHQLGL
jgi:ribosomal protein S27AE